MTSTTRYSTVQGATRSTDTSEPPSSSLISVSSALPDSGFGESFPPSPQQPREPLPPLPSVLKPQKQILEPPSRPRLPASDWEKEAEIALFDALIPKDPTLSDQNLHILFTPTLKLDTEQIDRFVTYLREVRGVGRYRVALWAEGVALQLKLVGVQHERAASLMQPLTYQLYRPHVEDRKVSSQGSARYLKTLSDGSIEGKEPDASWIAYSLLHEPGDLHAPAQATRPTVVLECGRSDSDAIDGNWWSTQRGEVEDLNDHTNLIVPVSVNESTNGSEWPHITIRMLMHQRFEPFLLPPLTNLKPYPAEKLILVDQVSWQVNPNDPNDVTRGLFFPTFTFYRQMNHLLIPRNGPQPPVAAINSNTVRVDSRLMLEITAQQLHKYGKFVGHGLS